MSDIQERLQKLLDGELDAAEVAEDPALASLADRLYGIKIQPATPKKIRDFDEQTTAPSAPPNLNADNGANAIDANAIPE